MSKVDSGNAAYIGSILSLRDTFAGNVRPSCPKVVLLALAVEQCRLSDAMQAPYHELGSLIFQNPACFLMVIVEVVLQLVSHHLYINYSLPNPPQLLWYHYLFIQNLRRQSSTMSLNAELQLEKS